MRIFWASMVFILIFISSSRAENRDVRSFEWDRNPDEVFADFEKQIEQCRNSANLEAKTTAEMLESSENVVSCYQEVGNKIIDTFYRHNSAKVKESFAENIKALYLLNGDLMQASDYARINKLGTMYAIGAEGEAEKDVWNLVLRYLQAVKDEFSEMDDFEKRIDYSKVDEIEQIDF